MLRSIGILTVVLALTLSVSAAQQKNVPVYGNWQGELEDTGVGKIEFGAKIIGLGGENFRMILTLSPEYADEVSVELKGKRVKGITTFKGEVYLGEELGGSYAMSGVAANKGVMIVKYDGSETGEFTLKRIQIKPPTLGMKPPKGAAVLMDGTEATFEKEWNRNYRWVRQGDGSIGPVGSSIVAKKSFGSAQYHIEFRTPYMPGDRGQGRGNSGVYVAGRYEVQVLDSFGDKPANNLCGGIYQIATPIVNACLPPNEWQTYDITFHAAKFEGHKKVKNAEIAVKHNGIVIHDKVSLPRITPGGVSSKEAAEGPLLLQDHGNFVTFRNVWIQPIN